MTNADIQNTIGSLTQQLQQIQEQLQYFGAQTSEDMSALMVQAQSMAHGGGGDFFMNALTVLVLAGIVGYYVIWNVTPALHAPLMGITNAISSVIILGALLATGAAATGLAHGLGFVAIVLASVNIFGGFMVTYRMLDMFRAKKK